MLSQIFLWFGLTLILAFPLLGFNGWGFLGSVLMIIGCLLFLFGK